MIVIVILILLSSIIVSYIHENKRLNVRRLMSYFFRHDLICPDTVLTVLSLTFFY